jgi:hypothetical protein
MPKKKTPQLQSIDPGQLSNVTGGAGVGRMAARYRTAHAQPQQPAWLSQLEQWAQSYSHGSPQQPASHNGQAGLAGTPGAWVHSGKFRPL